MRNPKSLHVDIPDATLCFLIRKQHGRIFDICLAMKKRGFGVGRWNGVGGKVETARGEFIEEATDREAREEIGVHIRKRHKVGVLTFLFPHATHWSQRVHVFLVTQWEGDPAETDEMQPQWFTVSDIPYSHMWPDDEYWLPYVLKGEFVTATFTFGPGDKVIEKMLEVRPYS